ncbi:uncharacterized protein LOC123551700 [Mercenaria mercenaria]|uniref:uncharacterized protein LOC123551700 n=1 Tax=Mercenaria mercenaria TaxID=6596 RepID=UPI00234FAEAD|nr:uncharacterized protein LOC123551700 [Mercenaria mercenaria]XP_045196744.2 uncharacterized protein LOC123551700 [Mercenaria mercenaria]
MKLLLAAIVSLFLLHTLGIPLSSNTRYMTIDQQLECYNCGSVGWNVESCNKTSICPPNNACFLSFSTTGMSGNYNLSCIDNKLCRDPSRKEKVSVPFYRFQCCYTNRCNKHWV